MENLSNKELKFFKGAGWLIGLMLAIVQALVVFGLSDSFASAISAGVPMGIIAGMSIENKFQNKHERIEPGKTKMMIQLILVGFILFLSLYFLF